jgi:preprotein translocase subunit YajC
MRRPILCATAHLSLMEVGDRVWTPSGREASVISVDKIVGEAVVEWSDGARGQFRISQLRRMPREPGA